MVLFPFCLWDVNKNTESLHLFLVWKQHELRNKNKIYKNNICTSWTYIFFILKYCFGDATPGVNFINILRMHLLYESKLSSFSLVSLGFVIFGRKNIGAKGSWKMLMKLTLECLLFVSNWHSFHLGFNHKLSIKTLLCIALKVKY